MRINRSFDGLCRAVMLLGSVGLAATTISLAAVNGIGCAAFAAALPTVSEIVSDGVAILGMVSSGVSSYFHSNPNPTKQAQIEQAIAKAHAALVAGEQLLAGVQDATAGQTAQAFASFAAAYNDLMALVAPLGIVPAQPAAALPDAGAVGATAKPVLVVPTPLALRVAKGAAPK